MDQNGEEKHSLFDTLVKMDYPAIWDAVKTNKLYKIECDDAEGFLSVLASEDGDMFLTMNQGSNMLGISPSFRARTFAGGGRNEKTRKALLLLALAIIEDKEN